MRDEFSGMAIIFVLLVLAARGKSTIGRVLGAPQGQMQGGATQAMRGHRRGAPTQQMPLRRRNPKGPGSASGPAACGLRNWVRRPSPISSLIVVNDVPASPPPRALSSDRKPHARGIS